VEDKYYCIAVYNKNQDRWTHLPFLKFAKATEADAECKEFDKKDENLVHKVVHEAFISCLEDF